MDVSMFEAERPRLINIATKILGASAEADDVVQEAWIRLSRVDDVDNPPAWLTTVVTRLCVDLLRKQRTQSNAEDEAPVEAGPVDPEADALVTDQVGGAMQVVLDTLAPPERAAFVLREVFDYPFHDISAVLGRSDTAVRKLASRARHKVRGAPDSNAADWARSAESRRVVSAFLAAARGGELSTLLSLLAPDAVMHTDLVGQRMGASPVYEGHTSVASRFDGAQGAAPVAIDGEPGAAWIVGGTVRAAFVFHVRAGLIREIELIADPDVLATMDVVPPGEEDLR